MYTSYRASDDEVDNRRAGANIVSGVLSEATAADAETLYFLFSHDINDTFLVHLQLKILIR